MLMLQLQLYDVSGIYKPSKHKVCEIKKHTFEFSTDHISTKATKITYPCQNMCIASTYELKKLEREMFSQSMMSTR